MKYEFSRGETLEKQKEHLYGGMRLNFALCTVLGQTSGGTAKEAHLEVCMCFLPLFLIFNHGLGL